VPFAFALARLPVPAKAAILALAALPLILPSFVSAYALVLLLGRSGIVTHWLQGWGIGFGSIYGRGGIVAVYTLTLYPYVLLPTVAAFKAVDLSMEEAAQNLGANPWITFWRVTLPAIRPGIVAAALFGFVASFGNLEMSLFLVGPGRTTLPIAILQYLEWKIDPTIAAVSVIQILLIAAALVATDRYVKLARVV